MVDNIVLRSEKRSLLLNYFILGADWLGIIHPIQSYKGTSRKRAAGLYYWLW